MRWPVKKLGALNNELKRGTAALDRLEVILREPIHLAALCDRQRVVANENCRNKMSRQTFDELATQRFRIDIIRGLDMRDELFASRGQRAGKNDSPTNPGMLHQHSGRLGWIDQFAGDFDDIIRPAREPHRSVRIDFDHVAATENRITVRVTREYPLGRF